MARRSDSDAALDRLYQLPLNEFVAARNVLARQAGPQGASIRSLPKPTLPAWAVNQLYWRQRATYQDLLDRAADLRATHTAATRGRSTDLRGASRAYEEAVDRALKSALAILSEAGHPVTDATRQGIATTLRGLPAEEPQGRLTRPIEPRGFEVLATGAGAGRVRAASRRSAPVTARQRATAGGPDRPSGSREQAARLAVARSAEEAALAAVRDAEQALRRDQFEAARAARVAERADKRLEQARADLQEAQTALQEAERAATAAAHAHAAAQARAGQSDDHLTAAHQRAESARRDVQQLARG